MTVFDSKLRRIITIKKFRIKIMIKSHTRKRATPYLLAVLEESFGKINKTFLLTKTVKTEFKLIQECFTMQPQRKRLQLRDNLSHQFIISNILNSTQKLLRPCENGWNRLWQ
jgi:hypothetical protein